LLIFRLFAEACGKQLSVLKLIMNIYSLEMSSQKTKSKATLTSKWKKSRRMNIRRIQSSTECITAA